MLEQNIEKLEDIMSKHLRIVNETEIPEIAHIEQEYVWGMEVVLTAAGYKVIYKGNTAYIEKF